MWVCQCDCGNIKNIRSAQISSKKVRSCGCLAKESISRIGKIPNNKTHGMSKTRVYEIWCGMIKRCNNKKSKSYKNYGGRGISVCKEWLSFEVFYKDMGDPPEKTSIERIDNNLGYFKDNCKWATRREQSRNTRRNVRINGEIIQDIADRLGLKNANSILRRIERGWGVNEATNTAKGLPKKSN